VIPWFLREGDAARQEIARLRKENARLQALIAPFPRTETCRICGRAMGLGFHMDDELWEQVNGGQDGVLCFWCADARAQELGWDSTPVTIFCGGHVLYNDWGPYEDMWEKRALAAEAAPTRQLASYLAEHYDRGDWETPAVQQEIRRLVKLATQ